MKTIKLFILLLALNLAPKLTADTTVPDFINNGVTFSCYSTTNLTSGAYTFTLQVTGTVSRKVMASKLVISAPFNGTLTVEKDGTQATTGTTVTPVKMNSITAPVASCYTQSDVGTGTTVIQYKLVANTPGVLDLDDIVFPQGSGTTRTLTFRVTGGTGNISSFLKWKEK